MSRLIARFALLVLLATALPALAAGDLVREPDSVCFWQTVRWNDLTTGEKKLWAVLGWSAESWDSTSREEYPSSEFLAWDELSDAEREALARLGYSPASWDNIDDYCGVPA